MKSERQIQVFNLSFLDTFCCALGAMILLFIVNSQLLTSAIQDAVTRYKNEAKLAKEEKSRAEQARQEAHQAMEESIQARKQAEENRNIAEASEQEMHNSQRLLLLAKKAAEEKSALAEKLAREAEDAKQKAEKLLREAEIARQDIEKARIKIEEKNQELSKINETLRNVVKSSQTQDDTIRGLVTQIEDLKASKEKVEQEKDAIEEKFAQAVATQEKLQKDHDAMAKYYQETKNKYDQLISEYENSQTKNQDLNNRIQSKTEEIKKREKEMSDRETAIKNQEEDIRKREEKIKELEKELAKKDEKSLFGIKLSYRRILLLVDRSGSIVQNGWKQVLIDTCKEILLNCEVEEFAIVAFSSDMQYYPQRKGLVVPGSKENKQKAIDWLEKRIPFGGATHLHESIPIAYENYGHLDAIFLLSDGLPAARDRTTNSLQKDIVNYIKKQVSAKVETKIITISIGYPPTSSQEYAEIYKYLHQISELTGGQYLGR